MAYRDLELTLLSARDLKNVNLFMRMDVYAVASISGDPMTRQRTPTDTSGGSNPSWNTTLRFSVPPSAKAAGSGWFHVLLRSERALGDRDVGEVIIPLAELLAGADGTVGPLPARLASYQVHTVLRGKPRGVLNVSYRIGPVVAPVERAGDKSPVIAYPVPQPQQPYNYGFQATSGAAVPVQSSTQRLPTAAVEAAFEASESVAAAVTIPVQSSTQLLPRPRHEEAVPPARSGSKSNGHGPNHVYMGPHTQIIFNGGGYPTPPQSNTIPQAKEDGPTKPKPKPYYAPTQPTTIPAKEEKMRLPSPNRTTPPLLLSTTPSLQGRCANEAQTVL